MLFYICLFICFIPIIILVVTFLLDGLESAIPLFFISSLVAAFPFLVALDAWSDHATDISKIVAQDQVIEVQQERIDSLSSRLNEFDYPEKSQISLDADSPWAAIVGSLTDAENSLAEAKTERAKAIRSVEARKRGPMSGVVSFVGDYES